MENSNWFRLGALFFIFIEQIQFSFVICEPMKFSFRRIKSIFKLENVHFFFLMRIRKKIVNYKWDLRNQILFKKSVTRVLARLTWFWHWHRRNCDIARDLIREKSTNVSDDFLGWSRRCPEKRSAEFREQCGWGWFTRVSRTFFLRRHCAFRFSSLSLDEKKSILCNHKK